MQSQDFSVDNTKIIVLDLMEDDKMTSVLLAFEENKVSFIGIHNDNELSVSMNTFLF
jgi:hypothetical protein